MRAEERALSLGEMRREGRTTPVIAAAVEERERESRGEKRTAQLGLWRGNRDRRENREGIGFTTPTG